jgi:hypothetical protein
VPPWREETTTGNLCTGLPSTSRANVSSSPHGP